MKKNKREILMSVVAVGIVIVVGVLFGRIYYPGYTPTTPESMYKSVSDFYSVVYDRSDVKEGTFKLWPKGGQRVVLDATLERFEIYEHTDSKTKKELNPTCTVVVVKTETDGWFLLSATFSKVNVNVKVNLDGEDTEIPVTFSLGVWQEITHETAEQLKQLLKSGETLKIKGEIKEFYLDLRYLANLDKDINELIEQLEKPVTKEMKKEAAQRVLERLGSCLDIKLHTIEEISL